MNLLELNDMVRRQNKSLSIDNQITNIKRTLVNKIVKYKNDNGLNQVQLASRCGLSQPRISDILNIRFGKLAVDGLLKVCFTLNISVDVV